MVLVCGITGLIASGKTTLTKYLIGKKYKVFDADLEVKKLYTKKYFIKKIKKIFFEAFNGDFLNKSILSNIIFNNLNKKKQLENIIHPIIENKCNSFIEKYKNKKIIFLDIPLLYEVGWDKKCDKTIFVTVNKSIQKQRYIERGADLSLFEKILKFQNKCISKKKNSTYIINNNKTKEYFYEEIDKILDNLILDKKYLNLSNQK